MVIFSSIKPLRGFQWVAGKKEAESMVCYCFTSFYSTAKTIPQKSLVCTVTQREVITEFGRKITGMMV